ncbi:MAG: translation initiation factor IF-6 [Candidatus Thermoplasmatota archaeon]|nr:translation initiation factor IF-6 [Candidatus Thermoplasmatota archaeon]
MALLRQDLFNSPYVGVFCAVSDALALLPPGIPADDRESISETLGAPVIEATVGGSRVLGTLVAMNSQGLLVSNLATGRERDALAIVAEKHGLRFGVLEERANAAGNNLLVTNSGGICSPRLSPAACEAAGEVLGVELRPQTLAEMENVGMLACVTARGGVCHPEIPDEERQALGQRLGVEIMECTANFGMPLVGAGVVATATGAVCGRASTGIELGRLEEALKLF